MSKPIIEVEGLSKSYQLGETVTHDTLRDAIAHGFRSIVGWGGERNPARHREAETLWALKDVNFNVQEGDVLGIIGRNGAGKSTLLKILSRITDPTSGTARIRGRVASLLEVGTGFHPELTGRENIFLNGAILGMTRQEMKAKFDEIVAFAEVDRFIDTPVKRYSSGMYVRLAFAVAAHIDPEVLIVDEVLAVGDAAFQKKCLGKMQEVGKGGRTVLFVSHNMGAVNSLTQKCIYLENGMVVFNGYTGPAVALYLVDSQGPAAAGIEKMDYYRPDYYCKPDRPVTIKRVWLEGWDSDFPQLSMGDGFTVCVEVDAGSNVHGANLSMAILNEDGQVVTIAFSWDAEFYLDMAPGTYVFKIIIKDLGLTPGKYLIDTGINQSTETTAWDGIKNYPLFEVINTGKIVHWLHRRWGSVHTDKVGWFGEKIK